MKKQIGHTLLLAFESVVFLVLIGWLLAQSLPAKSWSYSAEPEELRFTFSEGQSNLLERVSWCRLYFATYEDNVLSERQVRSDTNRCFSAGNFHRFNLPRHVTQVRIDFHAKDAGNPFENPPELKDVRLGDELLSSADLIPFFESKLLYAGYLYDVKPFMNGWRRVLIPAGGGIWFAVVVGAWAYFRRQKRNK